MNRATATGNTYRKFGEIWTRGFWGMRADRQTDRSVDRNASQPYRGEAIKHVTYPDLARLHRWTTRSDEWSYRLQLAVRYLLSFPGRASFHAVSFPPRCAAISPQQRPWTRRTTTIRAGAVHRSTVEMTWWWSRDSRWTDAETGRPHGPCQLRTRTVSHSADWRRSRWVTATLLMCMLRRSDSTKLDA